LKADARHLLWLGFLLPLLLPDYRLFYVISVVILIPVVVGYNLITGYGGLFVLTSGPMVGLGAVVATVAAYHGLVLPLSLVAGGIVAAAIGFFLGLLTVRLSGIVLALTSIGLGNVITLLTWTFGREPGGAVGGLAFPREAFGGLWPLPAAVPYLVVVAVALLGLAVSWRLVSGQWGRELRAMRTSESAARACGIDVERVKTGVVSAGCFYWGVAGALQAFATGFVAPSDFGLDRTTLHLAMLVIGGLGSFLGPVLGVLTVAAIQTVLHFSVGLQTVLFAALLYLTLLVMRGGLNEGLQRLAAGFLQYRRRSRHALR
jgi:branched-chain amino acid transport system permease protein